MLNGESGYLYVADLEDTICKSDQALLKIGVTSDLFRREAEIKRQFNKKNAVMVRYNYVDCALEREFRLHCELRPYRIKYKGSQEIYLISWEFYNTYFIPSKGWKLPSELYKRRNKTIPEIYSHLGDGNGEVEDARIV